MPGPSPRSSIATCTSPTCPARRVRAQTIARENAGWQKVRFDGRDDAGRRLANGVYFFRVSANGSAVTRKMVVAR